MQQYRAGVIVTTVCRHVGWGGSGGLNDPPHKGPKVCFASADPIIITHDGYTSVYTIATKSTIQTAISIATRGRSAAPWGI